MCGILLAIQRQKDVATVFQPICKQLETANSARGPDAQESVRFTLSSDKGFPLDVRFFASELRLRGDKPIVQPHVDSGNVLCWNGEIFEGIEMEASENDGIKLFETIKQIENPSLELPAVFQSIEGPYAFCYFHKPSKRIYFGRDPLGRRSLLIHRPTSQKPYLIVASVSAGANSFYDFEEIDTVQFHYTDLNDWSLGIGSEVLQTLGRSHNPGQTTDFSTPARVNNVITNTSPLVSSLTNIPPTLLHVVDNLLDQLGRSVRLMVQDIPSHAEKGQARVAVLFSGGIDSTILAYLADRHLPPDEPIDLLNVAFENPRKVQIRSDSTEDVKKKRKSARRRTSDSVSMLANVRFDPHLVPDRVTGLEELAELRTVCSHRQWNFVEVDVTFEEATNYRPIVEDVMHPCKTVMDLSLGLALYFASRGIGHIKTEDSQRIPYASTARVLLNGLGADELLGGYGRHRTVYNSGGWPALIEELQLEIDRIPARNLGRDDRIISSHGKEARHPFLSLSVVNYLAKLPVHYKLDPRLPLGLGDKTLLRLAARKVGLELASSRKKRAMQFGSHSARMESGGSERRGDLILS
ncbi:hypothetical protein ACEPAH_680 [Sanghuangporus vaninii]